MVRVPDVPEEDDELEDEDARALAPILEGLHSERYRRVLEKTMREARLRSGQATWLGGDRFEIRGTFTLLELTCIYVAARDCYPRGTVEGRRDRGAMPPGW